MQAHLTILLEKQQLSRSPTQQTSTSSHEPELDQRPLLMTREEALKSNYVL